MLAIIAAEKHLPEGTGREPTEAEWQEAIATARQVAIGAVTYDRDLEMMPPAWDAIVTVNGRPRFVASYDVDGEPVCTELRVGVLF